MRIRSKYPGLPAWGQARRAPRPVRSGQSEGCGRYWSARHGRFGKQARRWAQDMPGRAGIPSGKGREESPVRSGQRHGRVPLRQAGSMSPSCFLMSLRRRATGDGGGLVSVTVRGGSRRARWAGWSVSPASVSAADMSFRGQGPCCGASGGRRGRWCPRCPWPRLPGWRGRWR